MPHESLLPAVEEVTEIAKRRPRVDIVEVNDGFWLAPNRNSEPMELNPQIDVLTHYHFWNIQLLPYVGFCDDGVELEKIDGVPAPFNCLWRTASARILVIVDVVLAIDTHFPKIAVRDVNAQVAARAVRIQSIAFQCQRENYLCACSARFNAAVNQPGETNVSLSTQASHFVMTLGI